jgi:dolichol-phosphate mannosyltransferase
MDKIAVVIPCYRVAEQIENVISGIGGLVTWIICVDDKCPENSGRHIEEKFRDDPRVEVLHHERNKGVGAAVVTGYLKALEHEADVIVKLDGDGQMDAGQISRLVGPIIRGEADYTKGNRFYSPENIAPMPIIRIVGNAGLSFFAKLSTGYWEIFDPSNGFTAIQAKVARILPLEKVSQRYFFETDMLFRLSTLRAVVSDIPMKSVYGNERSNLNVLHSLITFPFLHATNFVKRIVYNYFVRDFNIATINLVLGIAMLVFGFVFGVTSWLQAIADDKLASPGTVMLASLPIIVGTQLTLNFLSYDMSSQPRDPVHKRL